MKMGSNSLTVFKIITKKYLETEVCNLSLLMYICTPFSGQNHLIKK